MQLRYKLAKETFKGKKVPPAVRTTEDHVSEDQRGNRSSGPGDPILSLGADHVTAVPKSGAPKEEADYSRRDLFGFFQKYADRVVKKEPPQPEKKKKKRKVKKKSADAPADAPRNGESAPQPAENAMPAEASIPRPGKNFFLRLWDWILDIFRPIPRELEEQLLAQIRASQAASAAAERKQTARTAAVPAKADGQVFPAGPSQPPPPSANAVPANKDKTQTPSGKVSGFEDLKFDLVEDADDGEEPEQEVSRRGLLRQGVHFFAKPAVDSIQGKIDRVNETVSKITRRVPLLRPPGAVSERQFLQACTRCDACIHACPKDAIRKAPKSFGMLVLGTPYIDPMKNPCVMCDGLPCISACGDNALLPVPGGPADVRMGYAILDRAKCQAYGDTFCQQCVIDCPIPGAITQKDNKPIIHKDVCTGCGVCVRSCSTVNIPVAIKVKPQMVIESQIRKQEMEKQKALEDAQRLAAKREAEKQELLEQQAAENKGANKVL
ncbi:MAG: 4Fe-4S dicluster domain-containing protein [Nitrospinae bacterium]|nr:4Fe-4S dicluster domain-containing protein [Nitrospinota bacterium]